MVIGKSIKAYVTEIESTPDSGVEIKKEDVAPVPAPDFLIVTAVGITAHEHKGSGIPIKDAFKIEEKLFFPKVSCTCLFVNRTRIIPLAKNPNNKYGEDSIIYFTNDVKKFIINQPFFEQTIE